MAFPTSGLVDNQVHKENNRSFVYDSTLLVWDQLKDVPDTISIQGANKGLDNVTLGSSIVFPTGHIRFLSQSALVNAASVTEDANIFIDHPTGTFTAGSKILVEFIIGSIYTAHVGVLYGHGFLVGAAASTGTPSHSGLGAGVSGLDILQEIGLGWTASTSTGFAVSRVITPTDGATSASYNFFFDERADGRTLTFYKMYMTCWEIYQ